MKRILFCTVVCLVACAVSGAMRPTPEYLKRAVVYQMVLRNFTRSVGRRRAFVAANLTDRPVAFTPSGVSLDPARQPMLAARFSLDGMNVHLGSWGYVAIECL